MVQPKVQLQQDGVSTWYLQANVDGGVGVVNDAGRWAWFCNGADLHSPGNVVAYWSDKRLKENVLKLDGYEERIMALRPVSFEWNKRGRALTGKQAGEREVGFIAQEAKAVDPRYTAENLSATLEDGATGGSNDPLLTVKKDEMIADLVALVQSLNLRIRDLEEKLG
jgi:hypothetical protein